MNNSPFQHLPAEVRIEIIRLAIGKGVSIGICRPGAGSRRPPLARTCKQLYSEARITYYAAHTFRVAHLEDFDWFVKSIGYATAGALRNIIFETDVIRLWNPWGDFHTNCQDDDAKALLEYHYCLERDIRFHFPNCRFWLRIRLARSIDGKSNDCGSMLIDLRRPVEALEEAVKAIRGLRAGIEKTYEEATDEDLVVMLDNADGIVDRSYATDLDDLVVMLELYILRRNGDGNYNKKGISVADLEAALKDGLKLLEGPTVQERSERRDIERYYATIFAEFVTRLPALGNGG